MNEPMDGPLGQFMSSESARPAVVVLGDQEVVVLGETSTDSVEVWGAGTISQHPATTPVTEVTDPEQWQVTVRRALLGLNRQRVQAMSDLDDSRARHTAELEQIRSYAIDKHRQGAFGQQELDEFLAHVGLKLFEPHIDLTFVITGSYEIATTDTRAACSLTVDSLTVDGTDAVCQLDQSSITCHTEVLDVAAITPEDAPPRVRIDYRISGTAVVASDDRAHVQADARRLSPDLSRVPGLIPGSDRHHVEIDLEYAE